MEDIEQKSNRYRRLTAQADRLNNAVTILKKRSITEDLQYAGQYPMLVVDDIHFVEAKTSLLNFIKQLIGFYDDKGNTIEEVDHIFETSPIKDQIRNEAKNILIRLEANETFTQHQFYFWDRVITIMGNERGRLYQDLRNR